MMSPTSSTIGPVLPSERIEALDILRGWAVFGILLADVDITFNIASGTDRLLAQLHYFFVADKFWPLFSLLFGLGFSAQLLRAEARAADFVRFYWRRLAVLLLMGLANHLFLLQGWRADILQQYAVVGVVLLACRRWSSRTLLIGASICLLINPVRSGAERVIHDVRLADPSTAQQVVSSDAERTAAESASREESRRLLRESPYWATVGRVAKYYQRSYTDPGYYASLVGRFLPLLLLGLYVGRRRLFADLAAHLPFVRRVMWWGCGLGLAGNLFVLVTRGVSPIWLDLTRGIVGAVGNSALSFSYAAAIVLLVQHANWKVRLLPLAAVGRMALTNYLFQSVVFAVACPHYGFGLFNTLSVATAWALAVVVFVAQVVFSTWWMRGFRLGPMEWLWRRLTYGKSLPMRVSVAA